MWISGRATGALGTFGTLRFQNSTDSGGDYAEIQGRRNVSNYGTELWFSTNPSGVSGSPQTRMVIAESGNVGIGETSPDEILHIKKNQSSAASVLKLENSAGGDDSAFNIDWQLASSGVSARIGAIRTNDPGAGDADLYFSTSDNGTTTTEALRIKHNGNVGIGTDAPDTKLELYHGVFKIQGDNNSNDAIYIGNDDNISHGGTAASGPYPSIYAENVLRVRQRIQIFDDNGAANELDIRDTAGTRRWYLRPTADSYFTGGNFGIGTDNPLARLDIKVDTAGNLLSRVWNSNTSGTGSSSMRIANSGNNAQGSRLEFSDSAYYVGTIASDRTNGMQFYTGQMANPTVNLRLTLGIDGGLSYYSPDGTNTIVQRMTDADVLSWSGDAGQLFSLSDSLTGTIFSVNDVSGVPSIEVDDDGTIRLAETFGNVLIGTAVDDGVSKLQLDGSLNIFKSNSESVTNYATTSHLILDNDST
jgi:hypothetical protein